MRRLQRRTGHRGITLSTKVGRLNNTWWWAEWEDLVFFLVTTETRHYIPLEEEQTNIGGEPHTSLRTNWESDCQFGRIVC